MSPLNRKRLQIAISLAIFALSFVAAYESVSEANTQTNIPHTYRVFLVLDVSGSMAGQKLDEAKSAARAFVFNLTGRLGSQLDLGLVAFSESVTVVVPLTTNSSLLYSGIDSLQAETATAIGDAICTTTQQLRSDVNATRVEVLMSDGSSNWGRDPIDAAQTCAVPSSTVVHTIAFGDDANRGVLCDIARITGGKCYTASTGSLLPARALCLPRPPRHSRPALRSGDFGRASRRRAGG